MFLYQKIIDRSTLRQGFQIPVEFHHLLKAMPEGMPQHGETRNVKVVIDGVGYDAQLKNLGFDRSKYDGHADVILFVRQQVNHPDNGCRMGFVYLGQVTMKSIEGSKPMQIVWHLNTPMSEATYAFASQYKAIG